ncbi:protein IL-40 isoform X6 [Rattus norvegicus]|uniref:protein IL-40 isoform X6 n=1 Tax=Rattus norvegicus TaxID=10116 RepID=UPI002FD7A895
MRCLPLFFSAMLAACVFSEEQTEEPVSQLQADFVLRDGDSGPTAELSCLASSGSPPITYRLVGNDGRVLAQQRPLHGKPANFSLPLSETSSGFQCVAENSISVDSSALILLPPAEARSELVTTLTGELPLAPTCILAGSLISIVVITSGMLNLTRVPEFNSQQPHGGSQPRVTEPDALF